MIQILVKFKRQILHFYQNNNNNNDDDDDDDDDDVDKYIVINAQLFGE